MYARSLLAAAALAAFATPAFAQDAASPAAAAAPAATTKPSVGATVYDAQGGTVGTIASLNAEGAVVDTGKNKATLPLASFGTGDKGLAIAMTRDQLDAAAAGAKAQAAASVTAGAQVKGPQGEAVGTIKSVDAQYAVLDTGKTQAKLPLNAFAASDGGLVIGMTKAQLEAAAGTAGKAAADTPKK